VVEMQEVGFAYLS